MGVNAWNEPLTRENFTGFFNRYSPAAYRSVYKMIGDTTRTESVLLDAFVEPFSRKKFTRQMIPLKYSDLFSKRKPYIWRQNIPFRQTINFR